MSADLFQYSLLQKAAGWANSILDIVYPSITRYSAEATICKTACAAIEGVGLYKKNAQIHAMAESENPNRSSFSKWITHPIKRGVFMLPLFLLQSSWVMNHLDSSVPVQSASEIFTEERQPAYLAAFAVSALPTLFSSYEVAKHSLKSLWATYQTSGTHACDKLTEMVAPIGNLLFTIADISFLWKTSSISYVSSELDKQVNAGAEALKQIEREAIQASEKLMVNATTPGLKAPTFRIE